MSLKSSDVQVQGSNDWSIASKHSTVNAGYYEDIFIKSFTPKAAKRSSLIHRGYYVRAKAMDHTFRHFLGKFPDGQVISFGAGFDSSYFRLAAMGFSKCRYVEIDFPDVVERKKRIVARSFPDTESRFTIVALDLRDLSSLEEVLFSTDMLNKDEPTLLISECAITYMDESSSSKLIEWCARTFTHATFAVYEQIRPSDGFGHVMQNHFNQLCIPLLSLKKYPDRESQTERYIETGWTSCQVLDMTQFYQELIPLSERQRIKKLEAFDEYEGFHEKCSHYIILSAATGSCTVAFSDLECASNPLPPSLKDGWTLKEPSVLRYGHAGCVLDGRCWLSGGFGVRPQGHGRMDDLIVADSAAAEVLRDKKLARMYHSMVGVGDRIIVYGGRTHPSMALSDIGTFNIHHSDQFKWVDQPDGQAPWPAARWRHASTALPTGLLICGGRNTEATLDDCWTLTVLPTDETLIWAPFHALPEGRHSSTVSHWNDRFVLYGGLSDDEVHCWPQCLVTDSSTSGWLDAPWVGPEPLPRYSHQSLVHNDQLVLLGGVSCGAAAPPGVCVIELHTWTCVEYSLPAQNPKEPLLLFGFNLGISTEDEDCVKLDCWGGGGPCFSFGTHFNRSTFQLKIPIRGSRQTGG